MNLAITKLEQDIYRAIFKWHYQSYSYKKSSEDHKTFALVKRPTINLIPFSNMAVINIYTKVEYTIPFGVLTEISETIKEYKNLCYTELLQAA